MGWGGGGGGGREGGSAPRAPVCLFERVCPPHTACQPRPPRRRKILSPKVLQEFQAFSAARSPPPPCPPGLALQPLAGSGLALGFQSAAPSSLLSESPEPEPRGDGCGLSSREERRELAAAPCRSQVRCRLALTLPGRSPVPAAPLGSLPPTAGARGQGHEEGAHMARPTL